MDEELFINDVSGTAAGLKTNAVSARPGDNLLTISGGVNGVSVIGAGLAVAGIARATAQVTTPVLATDAGQIYLSLVGGTTGTRVMDGSNNELFKIEAAETQCLTRILSVTDSAPSSVAGAVLKNTASSGVARLQLDSNNSTGFARLDVDSAGGCSLTAPGQQISLQNQAGTAPVVIETDGDTFDHATRPYQLALRTRAGTDALAAHVRSALELRPGTVSVSLDGLSEHDAMSRAAFLCELQSCAPELLPLVRLFYGGASTYCWWDGRCRDVAQGEGCEQGDQLAPALFTLGQHRALCNAASTLHPADSLVALLDGLYVITIRDRARQSRDTVVGIVERDCGIASNIGKTRESTATAKAYHPQASTWRSDKPVPERGLLVLGVPIGHSEYARSAARGAGPFGPVALPPGTAMRIAVSCTLCCASRKPCPAHNPATRRGPTPACTMMRFGTSSNVDGYAPAISDVLADSTELPPLASRMP